MGNHSGIDIQEAVISITFKLNVRIHHSMEISWYVHDNWKIIPGQLSFYPPNATIYLSFFEMS